MPNTYTQLHIMAVFAVKHRVGLILPEWKEALYQYITGTVQGRDHKMLRINGMPDHVHLFFGLNPKESISRLIQEVKENSSRWINEQGFCRCRFEWQSGYGTFSYARSQVDQVVNYIINQEQHHRSISFREEYLNLMREFGVDYDERYIFHDPL